ncbi:mucoidy inhibitor MuiA family protein [Antrihabitans sp. NCIMB 15449]|uniref:Mucoidy inhibitor MuiA family protein n=1 Tax=Antrihabitans spumae TaxID=3373370 RepID=A0ABW7JKT9_9NOCA
MAQADLLLQAPIVAVTVYPNSARVTRRGVLDVSAGDSRIALDGLPMQLDAESVRVAGRGAATVLGVDVGVRHHPETSDDAVAVLHGRRRALEARLRELEDAIDVESTRKTFLDGLSNHAGSSFARQIAAGRDPDVAGFAETLATGQGELRARQRALRVDVEQCQREIAAVARELDDRSAQVEPDRLAVTIAIAADADTSVEFEVSYLVSSAGWTSAYDVRHADDRIGVSWYGVISQWSGEDWPECDLALSTARVSGSLTVPDLSPWYLERRRPLPPMPKMARGGYGGPPGAPAPMQAFSAPITDAVEMVTATATVEQGVVAATYRPARPVAVPTDGEKHRATIAVLDMESHLDYITAPVLSAETYLRATATNTSPNTLLPGRAAIFHGAEFVGATDLESWAPGEEVELALGVDDRVRVERELIRRTAGRGFTSNRREAAYQLTITNHTPRQAKVTVRDQLPVSRDEAVAVKDVRIEPRPAEVTDLGEVTWVLDLGVGAKAELTMSFRVDIGKGIELAGWRD